MTNNSPPISTKLESDFDFTNWKNTETKFMKTKIVGLKLLVGKNKGTKTIIKTTNVQMNL